LIDLPIDAHLPQILDAVRRSRAVVVVADPGAGKTTRIPAALAGDGPVILLQPRRVAARSTARRIASERSWTVGREVGWHIRLERRFTPDTRLLVATEGILTARLQQDPLLSDFRTIIFDEFHERSLHADLGLALAREAWRARDDLRIIVMSATLDTEPVSAFLGDCPIIRVVGRTFPLEISYAPGESPADATDALLRITAGDILGFLPGASEIERGCAEIRARVPPEVDVLALYGALDAAEQDRALRPAGNGRRRVVVATNIAETSLTVPAVTGVFDVGLQKVARYDNSRGIDSLAIERITMDAADQRAGRAGRVAPGVVRRLWDSRDRLRPHREPEIHRIDLSAPVLDILAWGGDPGRFEWFDRPRQDAIDSAMGLLGALGAVDRGRLTAIGRLMQKMPVPPRLARILISGHGARQYARACAILAERMFVPPRAASTTSDLLSALDGWEAMPMRVRQAARDIEQIALHALSGSGTPPQIEIDEYLFRRALFSGYPDRVGQRRDVRGTRFRLASGRGAVLSPESGVHEGEFVVALDLQASVRADAPDSRIRLASRVEREWLEPTGAEVSHRLDPSGTVRAVELVRYHALILGERPAAVDAAIAAELLSAAYLDRPRSDDENRLLRRLRFAGIAIDVGALAKESADDARALADVRIARVLPREVAQAIARDAPDTMLMPSGRAVRLDYEEDGTVKAAVKLQEVFGLSETPKLGPAQQPLLLELLAPNGRAVQVTRDLRSFWDRTYPEVRKELRGRYPRHPWPEDPWTATPTARTKRRS
jgi:ATP-dependent helicase HrpB